MIVFRELSPDCNGGKGAASPPEGTPPGLSPAHHTRTDRNERKLSIFFFSHLVQTRSTPRSCLFVATYTTVELCCQEQRAIMDVAI